MFITVQLAALAAAAVAATSVPSPTVTLQPVSLAKGAAYARLVTPLARPADPVLDGRIWHCEGQVCRANAFSTAHAQSLGRECASAARKLGAFEHYQNGSEVLQGEDLAKCNTSARR